MAYPILETEPPQPEPELPSLDDQAKTAALVNAYGSNEVKTRLEAWRKIALAMTVQARVIGMTQSGSEQNINARTKLYELRSKEKEARLFVADRVAVELKASAGPLTIDPSKSRIPTKVGQDD
ncbi:Uncharacterised protein [Mycolicibacterium aurum]|uniref:Uncharacterized protein n=2 Tax=Mycolicibacterium aurum TaxID=1791 RepID=A0A3S4U1S9_MYCAU|nr:Uncharacterised protein [Mycolicibacterium aurum]